MRNLGLERRLGVWDRWGQLAGAWELDVGFEVLNMWWFGDMLFAVVLVEAVGGRSWDLVVRKGVGAVLGGSDLVGSLVGLSRLPGGIFLLWHCWRASGWSLGVVWMVAEAGMCLRAAVAAGRTTSLTVC